MKTLLVLAPHPDLAEAVRSGTDAEHYRVIHRANLEEAEPLLAHGIADACIVDVELTNVQSAWLLDKIRRRAPKCPLIVYTAERQWEWEEEAYLHGATHVLAKPVRARTLNLLLSRLWQGSGAAPTVPALPAPREELPAVASVGLSSSLLQHFELTFESGIGAHLGRTGRILRRSSDDARNPDTQKEFELLGVQVAVPILDRDSIVGAAVFDARITGELLSNPELELIFRLLEPLGLAIRNIWLHAQVAGSQEMLAGILRELSSACIVVNRDLAILHANKMARRHFSRPERQGEDLQFSDLPQVL